MNNRIGVVSKLVEDAANLQQVADYGVDTCQIDSWNPEMWTDELAAAVVKRKEETGIHISGLWAGWSGPKVWDFVDGPSTLGIVPLEYRERRVEELKQSVFFAKKCGLGCIMTHLGFIPGVPGHPQFQPVVEAVRSIAEVALAEGLEFWFETGQETPVTMLRLIEAVGTGNLGLNLDPANLILYGMGNPIDSLDVFGKYVKNIHVKDGLYPTDPMKLGREVQVGQGKVRFPEFLKKLNAIGFTGELIIEREISGEQQGKDIRETIEYLKARMAEIG